MVEHLPGLVNADAALVRRGQFLTTEFLVQVGEVPYLVTVVRGRIERVERGPFLLRAWSFAIRAPAEAWRRFWERVPAPGYHDLFAMAKRGEATLEGDLRLLMANLRYVKEVLAAPRRLAREAPHA